MHNICFGSSSLSMKVCHRWVKISLDIILDDTLQLYSKIASSFTVDFEIISFATSRCC